MHVYRLYYIFYTIVYLTKCKSLDLVLDYSTEFCTVFVAVSVINRSNHFIILKKYSNF